ncbi:MAG: ComF family protein [Verrucomicrobia bacterium]|nr:ComF family protein [Verrucomicrobiota bacterium]
MVLSALAPRVRRWGRRLAAVAFPPSCVHCGGLVEPAETPAGFRHLCPPCQAAVVWVRPPHCSVCGHPFHGIVVGDRECPRCVGLVPAYGEARTASLFSGPVRALVIGLKYHHGLHLLADCAALFRGAPHLLDHVRGARLVPVPLHPRKRRERGYNQSALLASELAREAGGETTVDSLLTRRIDTETQTAFDRERRRANLQNAFALAPGAPLRSSARHVLVDDVFTTGSTVNACARVLREAGVERVDVATLAHG